MKYSRTEGLDVRMDDGKMDNPSYAYNVIMLDVKGTDKLTKGFEKSELNLEDYLDEFDYAEIIQMMERFELLCAKYKGRCGGIDVETLDSKIFMAETFPPKNILDLMSAEDRRDIMLRQQNIQDLKTLQKIILIEEERVLSLDMILTRVLAFYRRFVPYEEHGEEESG